MRMSYSGTVRELPRIISFLLTGLLWITPCMSCSGHGAVAETACQWWKDEGIITISSTLWISTQLKQFSSMALSLYLRQREASVCLVLLWGQLISNGKGICEQSLINNVLFEQVNQNLKSCAFLRMTYRKKYINLAQILFHLCLLYYFLWHYSHAPMSLQLKKKQKHIKPPPSFVELCFLSVVVLTWVTWTPAQAEETTLLQRMSVTSLKRGSTETLHFLFI